MGCGHKVRQRLGIIAFFALGLFFGLNHAFGDDVLDEEELSVKKKQHVDIQAEDSDEVFVFGRDIFVNGYEYYVRGINYSMTYPRTEHYSQIPRDIIENDIHLIQQGGFNTVKTYEMVPDWLLDQINEKGLRLIETVCFPSDWTDFTSYYDRKKIKKQAIANVRRHKEKHGILAWSMWNDGPFTHGNQVGNVIEAYSEEIVNAFLEDIYLAIKKEDLYHPVTGSNIVEGFEGSRMGFSFIDFFSFNVYFGISDWLKGNYDTHKADRQMDDILDILDWTNKPGIIAETGYSTYLHEELQSGMIGRQIQLIEENPLNGWALFQWADDWGKSGDVFKHDDHIEEHWGLLDGWRKPKAVYESVKARAKVNRHQKAIKNLPELALIGKKVLDKDNLKIHKGSVDHEKLKIRLFKRRHHKRIDHVKIDSLTKKVRSLIESDRENLYKHLKIFTNACISHKGYAYAYGHLLQYYKKFSSVEEDKELSHIVRYFMALVKWKQLENLVNKRDWMGYHEIKKQSVEDIETWTQETIDQTKQAGLKLEAQYLRWLLANDLCKDSETTELGKIKKILEADFRNKNGFESYADIAYRIYKIGDNYFAQDLFDEYLKLAFEYLGNPDELIEYLDVIGQRILRDHGIGSFALQVYKEYLSRSMEERPKGEMIQSCQRIRDLFTLERQYEHAIEFCRIVINMYPRHSFLDEFYLTIAYCFRKIGKKNDAIDWYLKLMNSFPASRESEKAAFRIGEIYMNAGQTPRALRSFEIVLERYSDSMYAPEALWNMILLQLAKERYDKLRTNVELFIEKYPGHDKLKSAQNLFNLLQDQEDTADNPLEMTQEDTGHNGR
ncbi:tetratricopeptide repeat protein [PVC group bacterium]|nr:tetratricopeptide repeat protein [PVC group bacterium]